MNFIKQITLVIMERLESTVSVDTQLLSPEDKSHHAELQTALCGVVQVFMLLILLA